MINRLIFACLLCLGSIAWSNAATNNIERSINHSLEQAARLELDKDQLQQQIVDLEAKIHARKVLLLKRSSAISYLKNYQFGALLARSQNPSELDRNIKIFERLNQYDLGLFKDYNVSLKMLAVLKKNLETTIEDIAKSVEKLKIQQQQLLAKEAERLLEVNKKNIPSLLRKKGQLPRPLDGTLLWPFGSKLDSSRQFVFVSKGLLFKTFPNTEIKSVGPGTIIFSDVVPHWRETLIIQHDDNYYSVYTGVKSPTLRVNDSVESNQILGTTRSDEFYFELRHFDNPINPKNWFVE